jgi:hypothetical protein
MRKLILLLGLGLGLFSSHLAVHCQAQPAVIVSWSPVTNPFVSGYYLAWATSNGPFVATNKYPSNQTSGVISNLEFGVNYYVGVASFSTNLAFETNPVSPYNTNLIYFTNAPFVRIVPDTTGPPLPPLPPGAAKPAGTKVGTGNNNNVVIPPTALSFTNITQALMWGIPPVLTNVYMSNSQFYLTINGTVGATYAVQNSSNMITWTTFTTNVMTNIAPIATNVVPGQPQDAIDLAFVPGVQTIVLPTFGAMQWFRAVMPYDYAILASLVLTNKGYNTRLILVNLPGGIVDDCCYISQAGSFIHYGQITNQFIPISSVLQLEGSGPTIREIATTLASNLNMDWTMASEFTYSNGNANILATVVETDPPSSDPVAGTNVISSMMNIDF